MKINRRRKRAIAKAEKEMERYYVWKELKEIGLGNKPHKLKQQED